MCRSDPCKRIWCPQQNVLGQEVRVGSGVISILYCDSIMS